MPETITSHTPGPWSWTDGNTTGFKTDSGGESILAHARPSDDFFVLKIAEMDSNVPVHERTANARLIASAPDLLEALIEMEREKSDYMTRNNLGDPAKEHTNKMARAAIAKATGASDAQ